MKINNKCIEGQPVHNYQIKGSLHTIEDWEHDEQGQTK